MSFLGKVIGRVTSSPTAESLVQKFSRLPNRFCKGIVTCGASENAVRTATREELIDSLRCVAESNRSGAKNAVTELINEAQRYGVNLSQEAERFNGDVFTAAANRGVLSRTDETGNVISRNFADLAQNTKYNMDLYNTKAREIDSFVRQADQVSTEGLNLAHDIVDLSSYSTGTSHIFPEYNLNAMNNEHTITAMGEMLERVPQLSKENPVAVELMQEVTKHVDGANSKYFLYNFMEHPIGPECSAQMREAKTFVKETADEILQHSMPDLYLDKNSKTHRFYFFIRGLCNKENKVENYKFLRELPPFNDKKCDVVYYFDDILKADNTAIARFQNNLPFLNQVVENAEKQGLREFNGSGFLLNNVNLG